MHEFQIANARQRKKFQSTADFVNGYWMNKSIAGRLQVIVDDIAVRRFVPHVLSIEWRGLPTTTDSPLAMSARWPRKSDIRIP